MDGSAPPVPLQPDTTQTRNSVSLVKLSPLQDLALESIDLCQGVPETIAFLRQIGIPVQVVPFVSPAAFLDSVEIVEGALRITPSCRVSNLLHEAGHIACVPPAYRHLMSGNLYMGTKAMLDSLTTLEVEPDSPLMRAVIQCSDPEATAWAWAAGVHLGLPQELIILDEEYDGDGQTIRLWLQASAYLGINGLMHAGMCQNPRRPGGYPALRTWLQDATHTGGRPMG